MQLRDQSDTCSGIQTLTDTLALVHHMLSLQPLVRLCRMFMQGLFNRFVESVLHLICRYVHQNIPWFYFLRFLLLLLLLILIILIFFFIIIIIFFFIFFFFILIFLFFTLIFPTLFSFVLFFLIDFFYIFKIRVSEDVFSVVQ